MTRERPRKSWVLVTRPREQAEETARALHRRGFATLVDPLFEMHRVPFDLPPAEQIDAVILTSANAAHALGRQPVEKPVYVVGSATARAAAARGAFDIRPGEGEWRSLAERILREREPGAGILLHPSGREVASRFEEVLAPAGFDYRRVVVYEMVPREELGSRTRHALQRRAIGAVLLYSPRTAATFARLVHRAGLEGALEGVVCVCLSEAVAEEIVELPGLEVVVAQERDEKALLDALEARLGA